MENPILSKMNRSNNPMDMIRQDPQGMFNDMMQSNPQFAQFVNENRGKSPEQIAMEHGINPALLRMFGK